MLRRLALLLALLSPTAVLGQTAGQVLISPTAFGSGDCASTDPVTLTWTSSITPVAGANEIYRVWVSTNTNCPSTGTPTGAIQLPGGDIAAVTATQSYPTTLTRQDFISKAGIACTADKTIYVCVQHLASGETARAVATGNALLQVEPPPVPVSVSVSPGDSALFVSWAAGTSSAGNSAVAVSYNVTAAGATGTRIQNFTSVTGLHRVNGLTNGVTYSVTVTSVSAGGNQSVPSVAATGTPQLVDDFWTQYHDDNGHEQGGCGGGPAGVVSLLGVALALRGLRRRS